MFKDRSCSLRIISGGKERDASGEKRKKKRKRGEEKEIMRLLLYTKCPIIFMLYGAT